MDIVTPWWLWCHPWCPQGVSKVTFITLHCLNGETETLKTQVVPKCTTIFGPTRHSCQKKKERNHEIQTSAPPAQRKHSFPCPAMQTQLPFGWKGEVSQQLPYLVVLRKVKDRFLGPIPEFLIQDQRIWVGAWNFTFQTSSQEMPMLLFQEPSVRTTNLGDKCPC